AGLVTPGCTAILDGGTTALAVARALPPDLRATIVTHSPTVAAALAEHPTVDVLVLGGRLDKHSVVASGAITAEAAAGVWADVFLLGVTGVHPEAGLTTGNAEEAATKRTLASRAGDTYVLASAEKIGAASPFRVLPLADVTGIVTDVPEDDPSARALREAGAPLIPAP
ncbi:DeoR family transcriptional regulator, partial [Cellulomonas hominis]|nr:DeoR family transcriptional regulator [Cellulomonas hominis]